MESMTQFFSRLNKFKNDDDDAIMLINFYSFCFVQPLKLNNVDENIARDIDNILLNDGDKEERLKQVRIGIWATETKEYNIASVSPSITSRL